jgi:glycosyltransferase involved in cell wall biosynthesis
LLSAFSILRNRHARSERLVLAGTPGWEDSELRRRIANEFEPRAVVRVRVERAELPAWYGGAGAFVFPSKQETFGLPVLEAMACGTPVIASDIPVHREIAGEGALFFPPLDAHALADALLAVLESPGLKAELRERGLERAASFDWDTTARRTAHELRAAAEGPVARQF